MESEMNKLYAVSIMNATNQIWNLVVEETSKRQAVEVARLKVLAESDYRIIKVKSAVIQFPQLSTLQA